MSEDLEQLYDWVRSVSTLVTDLDRRVKTLEDETPEGNDDAERERFDGDDGSRDAYE